MSGQVNAGQLSFTQHSEMSSQVGAEGLSFAQHREMSSQVWAPHSPSAQPDMPLIAWVKSLLGCTQPFYTYCKLLVLHA